MFIVVTMRLMEPRSELRPLRCRLSIASSMDGPEWLS